MNDQHLLDALQIYCPAARPAIRQAIEDAGRVRWREAFIVLLDHLIKHDIALQSLTPGGSEYVNDRERCVRYATDVRRSLQEHVHAAPHWHNHFPLPLPKARRETGTVWRRMDGTLFATLGAGTVGIELPPYTRENTDGQ